MSWRKEVQGTVTVACWNAPGAVSTRRKTETGMLYMLHQARTARRGFPCQMLPDQRSAAKSMCIVPQCIIVARSQIAAVAWSESLRESLFLFSSRVFESVAGLSRVVCSHQLLGCWSFRAVLQVLVWR